MSSRAIAVTRTSSRWLVASGRAIGCIAMGAGSGCTRSSLTGRGSTVEGGGGEREITMGARSHCRSREQHFTAKRRRVADIAFTRCCRWSNIGWLAGSHGSSAARHLAAASCPSMRSAQQLCGCNMRLSPPFRCGNSSSSSKLRERQP